LKETPSGIVKRIPEKVFQFAARILSENSKDCKNRSALGQKGNVDTKSGRASCSRNTLVHLQSTRTPKLFVISKASNFAGNRQLTGWTRRRMRNMNINSLNFLRLDDLGIPANDKVAALILETFLKSTLILEVTQMALLASKHDGHIYQRNLTISCRRFCQLIVRGRKSRIGSRIAHLPNGLVNIDKYMTDLREATGSSFRRQDGFVRHNAQVLGRMHTRAVSFLHERLVHCDIAKLDKMFCFGFIINDFNLGKFAYNKRQHLVHEMVKHGDSVSRIGLGSLLTEQQSILQRLLTLCFGIKGLGILYRTCTTWKHLQWSAKCTSVIDLGKL
jgi:hypothetical protein